MPRSYVGRLIVGTVLLVWAASAGSVAQGQAADKNALLLGTIDFPTSASGEVQAEFELGVLALHSFWYEEAREHFSKAQELDPSFGMAYWGEAMTYDNPFLTEPAREEYERLGQQAVARLDQLDTAGKLVWSEREQGYANAIRWRFAASYDFAGRRQAYAEAMDQLSMRYPEDDEAAVFTELAVMALPGFDREQPLHVVDVASRLEELYQRNPEHPGVLHYLIHAYDTQTFARMGLRPARTYAEIAPASSHALHMPSHIFRHLGMWDEVAASNEASYAASVEWQKRTGRPLHMRDYHAMDWLLDAYLRLNRFDEAKRLMDELDEIEALIENRGEDPGEFASVAETLRAYYSSVVQ